ncbi:30S ribosomal protein S5 [Rickettsiales endosymbiont of Trichoplax sp. H2]|uniref:30S ribosomal protein S5 n=1 Tax=Rickettsiales endosymbiont of Trichoplax sp. H2 TaxID=2021221 RepID=UPI0012B18C8D|nr:30S ribosomal protein S5 [Rickettsiales endosymbiont of Trichoplax sp. H2]MSO13356.1 30S ribosomal protein S5 [Rickettsiales endosymbiont of Trichoplax sp. H2]
MVNNNIEIVEKLVKVNRCTKVTKGGRKFSFSVIVVVGDKKGKVGYGLGKADEVMDAKRKASDEARKNMFKIPLREGRTLHHDIVGKFCSGKVVMRAAPAGTGVIAGGPTRPLFEVLGIKDIVAKSVGSNNPHNVVKAAIMGLRNINTPKMIADKRGKKLAEIASQRETT